MACFVESECPSQINPPAIAQWLEIERLYGDNRQRIVGYDNEHGKGDHKHLGALEFRYKFESVDKMIADFLHDVERMKNEPQP